MTIKDSPPPPLRAPTASGPIAGRFSEQLLPGSSSRISPIRTFTFPPLALGTVFIGGGEEAEEGTLGKLCEKQLFKQRNGRVGKREKKRPYADERGVGSGE